MAIGEGNEEVRRSIRMLGVYIFESRKIAVVIVVVRDELLVSEDLMSPGSIVRLTSTSTSGSSETLAGGAVCQLRPT